MNGKSLPSNNSHRSLTLLSAVFLCLLSATACFKIAHAQTSTPAAKAGFNNVALHIPLQTKDIDSLAPGAPLTVSFLLRKSQDAERKARAFMVRDGNFTEVGVTKTTVNENDQAVYMFALPAPVAELTYRFVLPTEDGGMLLSPRYSVRRSCLPRIGLTEERIDPALQGKEKALKLARQAQELDQDNQSYERVIKLIGELETLVSR